MPLTISAIGYYSVTLKDFQLLNECRLYRTKLFELNEVTVRMPKFHGLERSENLRFSGMNFLELPVMP